MDLALIRTSQHGVISAECADRIALAEGAFINLQLLESHNVCQLVDEKFVPHSPRLALATNVSVDLQHTSLWIVPFWQGEPFWCLHAGILFDRCLRNANAQLI